jgi:hypothetical protein
MLLSLLHLVENIVPDSILHMTLTLLIDTVDAIKEY